MNNLLVRIRMGSILKKMNKVFDKNDFFSGPQLDKLLTSSLNRRAIQALEESGCIQTFSSDDEIDMIYPGERSALYGVERAELWLNRIVSYIAGIGSTLFVQWIITHLS